MSTYKSFFCTLDMLRRIMHIFLHQRMVFMAKKCCSCRIYVGQNFSCTCKSILKTFVSFRKFSVCCEKTCSCTVTMPNPSWVSHQPGKNNMKIVLKCSDITYIISKLVNADQTYLSIARTMITGSFPGPVTKELGNMIHKMVSIFDNIRGFSRKDILDLLLKLLVSVPNWNTNNCVLYLLDIVCAYAFGHNVCHWTLLEFFEKMHFKNNKKSNSSSLFSIFSSFGSQGQNLIASGNSQFSWLFFFIFQAEENYMQKSGLWRALVSELSKGKTLDESLTEAGKLTETNPPKSNQLIIYR